MRRQPFAKIDVSGQAIGHDVGQSTRRAAIENAAAFGIGKAVDPAEQNQIFRGQTSREKMNLNRARGGDFPRVIGLDAAVAAQFQELESVQGQVLI